MNIVTQSLPKTCQTTIQIFPKDQMELLLYQIPNTLTPKTTPVSTTQVEIKLKSRR